MQIYFKPNNAKQYYCITLASPPGKMHLSLFFCKQTNRIVTLLAATGEFEKE